MKKLLKSSDYRIRAAAMNVLRFHFSSVPEAKELLTNAANDIHGRVRMTLPLQPLSSEENRLRNPSKCR